MEYPTTVQVSVPAFTPKPYTIKFYDMKGRYLEGKDVEVNGQSGSVKLSTLLEEGDKFNNDAVMFQIADCADQALITVDVTMEALDPYIQSIDIVCHDYEYQDQLTQTFTGILLKPNNIIHSPKLKYFHCLSAFRTGLSLADFIMMAGSIGVTSHMKFHPFHGEKNENE